MTAPVRAYIGLGANLGDSAATLRAVLAELAAADGIAAVTASPFYRTAPVDATGPDFVNAVAALDTTLAPLDLLDLLQALELRHGRECKKNRFLTLASISNFLQFAAVLSQTVATTSLSPRVWPEMRRAQLFSCTEI